MPKNNEIEATVNNSSHCVTSTHETGRQATTTTTTEKQKKSRLAPLSEELKQQFIDYFMQRYPCTKKIKIKRHYARYAVRVLYCGENPHRTFRTVALTYEQLVMRTEFCYSTVRGLTPEHPVH